MMVPSEGELFKKILGDRWSMLHPDIQARFDKNPLPGKPLYYTGRLSELRCSRIGCMLGYLSQPFIKGALMPYNDADFPVDIQVYSKRDCAWIFKQRTYRLNARKPVMFTSFMAESAKGDVLEYVGMGLGMKLVLDVRDGNLHFESDGYFWEMFGVRIPLPGMLTPGKTYLRHRNNHANQFDIHIEIRHVLFGTTFTQAGVFRELAYPLVGDDHE
ncbi:DUF4166 domain-containing protein [Duganella aceris]|uniref:DUF4166 domain-containing protein n=1 Tax=Duganella aceris TaxID=2703883 RepID=A0ABX0FEP2_9BURK|nr:DUF4166 domain-containing protein [Duganella aceris]NGZ83020.1 DUF4166 domain-containing protein [Duganella aceris]